MPLADEMKAHLQAVIEHLLSERYQTQQQINAGVSHIKEINHSIVTLQKSLNSDASPSRYVSAPLRPPHLKYSNVSVRWAILDLLHDKAMTTPELADALKAAGVESKAANFANNVSAVLSTTMKEAKEVQQLPDGRWELTATGIEKIEHIRTTPKFRRGCGLS
jgi:hypothetical protein